MSPGYPKNIRPQSQPDRKLNNYLHGRDQPNMKVSSDEVQKLGNDMTKKREKYV